MPDEREIYVYTAYLLTKRYIEEIYRPNPDSMPIVLTGLMMGYIEKGDMQDAFTLLKSYVEDKCWHLIPAQKSESLLQKFEVARNFIVEYMCDQYYDISVACTLIDFRVASQFLFKHYSFPA